MHDLRNHSQKRKRINKEKRNKTKIMYKEILLIIITTRTIKTYDIKLFDKIGIAIEDLKSTVTVTNGFMTTQMSIELNLPTIDADASTSDCAAANNSRYQEHVRGAVKKFEAQIEKDLAEFVDNHPQNEIKLEEVGELTVEKIKAKPILCDSPGVTCKFHPIIDLNPTGKAGQKDEYKLRACYNSALGIPARTCALQSGTGVCCAKKASKNTGHCPTKGFEQVLTIINRHEAEFPDRTHSIGKSMSNIHTGDIQNYCVAILSIEINGKKTDVGGFSDLSGHDAENLPAGKRKRRNITETRKRTRRSNWEYYTEGGFFSSTYIDNQIQTVKDIATADRTELSDAIKRNSKVLLTLQADQKEHEQLKSTVCASTQHLSEALYLSELRSTQAQLEFKYELILRNCARNLVPDQIDTAVLTKICTAKSDSGRCYGKAVRSLFSCKLTKPLITTKKVGIRFTLTMQVPIEEVYRSYRIHSIGVPYQSNAIDVTTNYTENSGNQNNKEPKESQRKASRQQIQEILRELLLKDNKPEETRKRREILSTYHYLKIKDLPEIAIESEGDLITFRESSCKTTPFGILVDYSQNSATDSECVRAIYNSIVPKISHFCSIELESSNYNCMIKNIGTLGYLLSTTEDIIIQDISQGQNSVFNSKAIQKCNKGVCAVTVGKAEKKFRCGQRSYSVGAQPDVSITVKSEKLDEIKLQGFTARKDQRSDLLLSGFELLDRTPINRKILARASTFSIIFSLLGTTIVVYIISRIACKYSSRWCVHLLIWIICLPNMILRKTKRIIDNNQKKKRYATTFKRKNSNPEIRSTSDLF